MEKSPYLQALQVIASDLEALVKHIGSEKKKDNKQQCLESCKTLMRQKPKTTSGNFRTAERKLARRKGKERQEDSGH